MSNCDQLYTDLDEDNFQCLAHSVQLPELDEYLGAEFKIGEYTESSETDELREKIECDEGEPDDFHVRGIDQMYSGQV